MSSVYAQVVPWGNWQLSSDLPFTGMRWVVLAGRPGVGCSPQCSREAALQPAHDRLHGTRPHAACTHCGALSPPTPGSVLDAWVKGSVLTNGAIYLEDTINRRQSKWLSLDTAARGDARVLAGPTNDGWYHIQARAELGRQGLVGAGGGAWACRQAGGCCCPRPCHARLPPTDTPHQHPPARPLQVNFVKLSDSSTTKLSALPSMWNK